MIFVGWPVPLAVLMVMAWLSWSVMLARAPLEYVYVFLTVVPVRGNVAVSISPVPLYV